MSGPVRPPLTVETIDGTTVGRPITTIKVTNGTLAVSGSTATLTISGGGGGSGTVTSIATTSPITGGTITTTGTIGISQADTTTDGFLSSTDWNTFNGKQGAITLTTTGTSGTATLVGSTLNIPNYSNSATIGGTIANTQVAYGSATDAIQGSANLTFDGSNLSVGGYIKSGGVYDTTGATDLVLKTNGGTNSGTLTLKSGVGGNAIFQPDGTGVFQFNGVSGGNDGAIKLMCSEATHSQTISAAPHASAATYSLVLPTGLPADADNKYLVSDTSGNMSFTTGGSGSVTFPLEGSDGSAAAPTYSFSSATNLGFYKDGSTAVSFTSGGTRQMSFDQDGQIRLGGSSSKISTYSNNLVLDTDAGSNSGSITINAGVNGNIAIAPDGTGNVSLGNFTFDADQTVGAGQDNYVLTYDNSTTSISLEAAGGGSSNDFSKILPQIGSMSAANQYNIATSPPWGGGQIVNQAISSMGLGARPYAFPFISPETGTVTAVGLRVETADSGINIYVGIYDQNSSNQPDTRLGYATVSLNSTGTIFSTSITGTISLTAGEQYWYTINADANVFNAILDSVSTNTGSYSATPLGLTDDLNTLNYSIKDTTVSANAIPPTTYSLDDLDGTANRIVVGLKF